MKAIEKAIKERENIDEYEIKCGNYFRPQQKVIINCSSLFNDNYEYKETVVVIRDITKIRNLENELMSKYQYQQIVGKSEKIHIIKEMLNYIVDVDTTVLITGESGTGKTLLAKVIHFSGKRAKAPLVVINCSTLSENLLESELFGHVKGSFTGAIKDVRGRFEVASGGTIVLEEVGEMSPRIQLKLLRFLEEKIFERVGDSIPIKVDVRVIACTNSNLKEKVRKGEFREDLYYRLKVMEIKMPPLRERVGDIPLLVEHFIKKYNDSYSKNITGISEEVQEVFLRYPWPGNVRELANAIEHSFILCRGHIIDREHLPGEINEWCKRSEGLPIMRIRSKSEREREYIINVLEKVNWNKSKAAKIIGIDRSTLYRKLKRT